ncbi:MAG: alpha-glucosidase [Oscillospiraceae bacterium]|jgi:oligo-1,6-glucosidase|nr:alpha-glucosidase [Oscillospiraceae bacterium]
MKGIVMKTHWYKDAVIYQVYPRSFADGNGDGVGDIPGIIGKLDYLKDLSVDAVWLSPCYPSPNDDNGYDISDYRGIHPEFGTLDDWKALRDGLHARGMKLIMDLVVNHTSDEHPWFVESRKGKDNPYHDYYIWRDGSNGRHEPPNGWGACFGGSAWEWDETFRQYFLHLYSKKQPDLNWRNPKVRQEVADICNYWLELGCDGFRCDVIPQICKTFSADGKNDKNICADGWFDYIRELGERSWNNYDTMIVGECVGVDHKMAPNIHGEGTGLLDSVISFDHLPWSRNFRLPRWKEIIRRWQTLPEHCWWSQYWENHDQQRSVSRFVKPGFEKMGAKMLLTLEMFLRGTPYIYEGQELGMVNIKLCPDEFMDIQSVNMLRGAKNAIARFFKYRHLLMRARDHARTPMQWDNSPNAGFTTAPTPWMKVNPNYTTVNARTEAADPDSVLNYTKRLLRVRKGFVELLKHSQYTDLAPDSRRFYAYRQTVPDDKSLVVIALFGKTAKHFSLPEVLRGHQSRLVVSNNLNAPERLSDGRFLPYEVRVYELGR